MTDFWMNLGAGFFPTLFIGIAVLAVRTVWFWWQDRKGRDV